MYDDVTVATLLERSTEPLRPLFVIPFPAASGYQSVDINIKEVKLPSAPNVAPVTLIGSVVKLPNFSEVSVSFTVLIPAGPNTVLPSGFFFVAIV